MFAANQQFRPHRVNNHFQYNHRNKKKGVIVGGRKTPAESKAIKNKPKRIQMRPKPTATTVPAVPDAAADMGTNSAVDPNSP